MPINESAMSDEQRALKRHQLTTDVDVYDRQQQRLVGRLVNLHSQGMMLVSDQPIEDERIYQFELRLATADAKQEIIQVGVDCLWSRSDASASMHWSGFQIIDASMQALEQLDQLVARWANH